MNNDEIREAVAAFVLGNVDVRDEHDWEKFMSLIEAHTQQRVAKAKSAMLKNLQETEGLYTGLELEDAVREARIDELDNFTENDDGVITLWVWNDGVPLQKISLEDRIATLSNKAREEVDQ